MSTLKHPATAEAEAAGAAPSPRGGALEPEARPEVSAAPRSPHSREMRARNLEIRRLYQETTLTLEEIGERFGLSQQRVHQLCEGLERPEVACRRGHSIEALHVTGGGTKRCLECRPFAAPATHCRNGHALSPENVYEVRRKKSGGWTLKCKRCHSAAMKRYNAKRRAKRAAAAPHEAT